MSREKFNNWFETRYPNIQKTIDEHGYHESAVFKENMWECWQEQQKVIDELESHQEKQSECIKNSVSQRNSASSRVESSLISIENFFDDQVQNPTLRQYANFIQEIYETLRGEP